ncbi:hypothetical protein HDE_13428 [Halotydeus destructor]|nr:hypothetical protein HDE_13428 [Halotydeus destructor]
MPKSRKTLALDVSHLNALNESTVAHAGDQSNMSILNETIISPTRSNSYIMPHINQNSSRSSSAVYASNYHQSSYSSCIQQSALPPNIRSLRSPVNAAHNPVNRLFATDHAMYHESSVELRSPVYNPALQSPQTMHYPSPFHKPGGSVKTDQFSDSSSLSSANSLSVTKNLDSINYHTFPVIIVKNPDLGFAVTDSLKDAVNEKNASVSAVKMNGPASTALKVGDRILRIDDIDLCNVDHETVKAILNSTGPTVSLLVRRNAANVKYL